MRNMKRIILGVMLILLTCGCIKRDHMDDIDIYTTIYPVKYLVDNIYGYNSNVTSIYPKGANVFKYELTNKQLKKYAKTNMFIYNGLGKERQIAASLLNYNHNLKVIDASYGMNIQKGVEELWLCPANYLMLAQNIKDNLINYVNTTILKQEIEEKYEDIKLIISNYDAELKTIASNADNKKIIAGNDVFKFLEKYGFKVLSIEDNESFLQSEFQDAKNSIVNKSVSYVFVLDSDPESENITNLKNAGAEIIKINSMLNINDDETYQKLMAEFIENIKLEVYDQ